MPYTKIKKYFDMNSNELLGMINLMKGNVNDDNFFKFLDVLLRKNDLQDYFQFVADIILLAFSKDKSKIKKALSSFYKFVNEPELFSKLSTMYIYLRGLIPKESSTLAPNSKIFITFSDIYESFPTKRFHGERRLKDMFNKSIIDRDYPSFKLFRDRHFRILSQSAG